MRTRSPPTPAGQHGNQYHLVVPCPEPPLLAGGSVRRFGTRDKSKIVTHDTWATCFIVGFHAPNLCAQHKKVVFGGSGPAKQSRFLRFLAPILRAKQGSSVRSCGTWVSIMENACVTWFRRRQQLQSRHQHQRSHHVFEFKSLQPVLLTVQVASHVPIACATFQTTLVSGLLSIWLDL